MAQKWRTFTTAAWRFLLGIVTDDPCVFTVAAVVPPDILFDTVSQGLLTSCALHIIHVDGSFSFPKISHGPCSGRTPRNRVLQMWGWLAKHLTYFNTFQLNSSLDLNVKISIRMYWKITCYDWKHLTFFICVLHRQPYRISCL